MPKKKTKAPAYTTMTLAWMRSKLGLTVDKTEHWIGNPHMPTFMRKRKDLFNIIDVVGMADAQVLLGNSPPLAPGLAKGILGVQSTSYGAVSQRITKAYEKEQEPRLVQWILSGNHFWVVGWKRVLHGKKQIRWRPRIFVFSVRMRRNKAELRHMEVTQYPGQDVGNG